MRIGVDYRVVSLGSYLARRGMGRYTQQQVRAVLDAGHEYVLLCEHGTDPALIDPAVRLAPDVSVACRPPPPEVGPGGWLEEAERYLDWVASHDLDLYHATTPFVCVEPVLAGFDACPVVATWYDAIPLLHPDRYLVDPCERDCYLRGLGLVMAAGRLISISGASRDDAVRLLGRDPATVDVAWPIPDPCFRPLSDQERERALASLRRRVSLPPRYVLSVTFPHYTKNLDGLLRGYARLAPELRAQLPLVLVFDPAPAARIGFLGHLAGLGIDGDVVVTGLVGDRELAGLYSGATVVVHPSRHEGFGLPVVEAMRCGAPVVTTTVSCLPEVAGGAALLVDPDDENGFARAVEAIVDDADLAADLRRRGVDNAARFGPEQLRQATLGCYQQAASGDPVTAGPATTGPAVGSAPVAGRREHRLRLAVWTPLPPQPTGVADYSEELIGGLRDRAEVAALVDDGVVPALPLLWEGPVHHHSAWARIQAGRPFDATVYQLGASAYHLYMAGAMHTHPGVVVVHDLPWSYVLYSHAGSRGELDRFRRQFARDEGDAAARWLEEVEKAAAAGGVPVGDSATCELWNEHPMLRPLLGASQAVVVHSPAAARDVEAHAAGVPVHVVPMGVADPLASSPSPEEARALLGVAPDDVVIGAFGIVHPTKRLESCIRALARLRLDHPRARLVVIGGALDPAYVDGLTKLARQLGVAESFRLTGHLDRPTFDRWLVACDLALALRRPTMRQTSAVVLRAAAAGKPVVVTDSPYSATLPDGACRRVPAGPDEVDRLAAELALLAGDEAARRRLGGCAREHFEHNGTIAHMVSSYLDVIASVTGRALRATTAASHRPPPALLALAAR